jgi:hypothetical protein
LATINLAALTSVGNSAFSSCTALTTINLAALTTLGTEAFRYSGLRNVTLPASVATLPNLAFANCASLEWVKILKDGVVAIPSLTGAANFPFTTHASGYGNSTSPAASFPRIYVPHDHLTQYQTDWVKLPALLVGSLRDLDDFTN